MVKVGRARATPMSLPITALAVATIVVGIMAMHMWMGMGSQEMPSHATSTAVTTAALTGQDHVMTPPAAHKTPFPDGLIFAMDCGGEMIAGACAMIFLVISIVVAMAQINRSNYGLVHHRALPRITLPHRTRPYTPSLVQLCISRT